MNKNTCFSHDIPASTFKIVGARGCVGRWTLSNGLAIYRAELQTLENCEVTSTPTTDEPSILFSKYLVGDSVLQIDAENSIAQTEDVALIKRFDQASSIYRTAKGTTLRYVAVLMPVRLLVDQIGRNVPPVLESFLSDRDDIRHVCTCTSNRKIDSLATRLFLTTSTELTHELFANGQATLFVAEIVTALCGQQPHKDDAVLDWENHVFSDLKAYIDSNLHSALSRAFLAAKFDISESNLNRLFIKYTKRSYGDYVREKRMELAYTALQNPKLSIGEVAQSVGYNHVSNFSRAYRKRYGETPSRVLQRSRP